MLAIFIVSSALKISKTLVYKTQGDNTNILVWSLVETGAAIIGACLPTLRPLLQHYSPESMIGSLRSVFSLRSQSRSAKRQGYDETALQGDSTDLQSLRKIGTKNEPSPFTMRTGSYDDSDRG